MSLNEAAHTDAADGDDELVTNDEDEPPTATPQQKGQQADDYFQHTPTARPRIPHFFRNSTESDPPRTRISPPKPVTAIKTHGPHRHHSRTVSTNTILYDPPLAPRSVSDDSTSSPSRKAITARNSARNTGTGTGTGTPAASTGRRTPKRLPEGLARARPIMPSRSAFQSAPDLAGLLMLSKHADDRLRRSSLTMDIGSDLGDNKAVGGGFVTSAGMMPASFATQMAFASRMAAASAQKEGGGGGGGGGRKGKEEADVKMGKLMLARMNGLEEGFREVLKEVKDWRRNDAGAGVGAGEGMGGKTGKQKRSGSRTRRLRAGRVENHTNNNHNGGSRPPPPQKMAGPAAGKRRDVGCDEINEREKEGNIAEDVEWRDVPVLSTGGGDDDVADNNDHGQEQGQEIGGPRGSSI